MPAILSCETGSAKAGSGEIVFRWIGVVLKLRLGQAPARKATSPFGADAPRKGRGSLCLSNSV
ncbi:MAG TPA: hypothetical protein VFS01_11600 [Rhizomicrobium sp.]|jgi:hypothetical protein|nr:hypothetical protein [Rhizomicrobium sp.]